MRFTYLDILEQCFHDRFRGYDKQEVETFLQLVADDFKEMADEIEQLKGIPIQEKVGHSFIKKRMAAEDAIFGGELTGHYYFRDFYFMDSAVLPALIFALSTSETYAV